MKIKLPSFRKKKIISNKKINSFTPKINAKQIIVGLKSISFKSISMRKPLLPCRL